VLPNASRLDLQTNTNVSQRFQSLEHVLAWFSPCVLFCVAPFLVIIGVYTVVRIVKGRQGSGRQSAASPFDHGINPPTQQVNARDFAFTKVQPKPGDAPSPPAPPAT
jgi:hypothetical protein